MCWTSVSCALGCGGYGRESLIGVIFFCSRGQAKKEFKVGVEAIGHVRHKNLVRLLGYYAEGTHKYFDL